MGIKDLYKVIEDEAGDCFEEVTLHKLSGLRIAIDISIFLYRYIRTAGNDGWMNLFIGFLCKFLKHNIITVCIFDGPNPPSEKKLEQLYRRETVKASLEKRDKIILLRDKLAKFEEEDDLPEEIVEECRSLLKVRNSKKPDLTNYYSPTDIITSLQKKIDTLDNQTLPITSEHRDLAFQIVNMMGLHAIQADGEAEGVCSYLAKIGEVHGVLSEDTDCLAYGAPFLFVYRKNKATDEKLFAIHLQTILDRMGYTYDQFLDLCILLKCDYNKHTYTNGKQSSSVFKGYIPDEDGNIPKNAKPKDLAKTRVVELMRRFGSFERIREYLVNPEDIKYERCREIFLTKPVLPLDKMYETNLAPDFEALDDFIIRNQVYVNMQHLRELLKPTPILFDSTSGDDHASIIEEIFLEEEPLRSPDEEVCVPTSSSSGEKEVDITPSSSTIEYAMSSSTVEEVTPSSSTVEDDGFVPSSSSMTLEIRNEEEKYYYYQLTLSTDDKVLVRAVERDYIDTFAKNPTSFRFREWLAFAGVSHPKDLPIKIKNKRRVPSTTKISYTISAKGD